MSSYYQFTWLALCVLYHFLNSLVLVKSSGIYDFTAIPDDAIVYSSDKKNQGFAVLNCVFNPSFDGVSWQYLTLETKTDDATSNKQISGSNKWADVFIDGKSHSLFGNNSLKISPWPDDSSDENRRYRCIGNIRNWGSVISPAGRVSKAVPPFAKLSNGPVQSKEYESGLLKLFCPVDGFPHPEVKWFKNDVEVSATPRITAMHLTDYTYAALEVSNLQIQDQGMYSCEGSNSVGEKRVYVSQLDVIKGHTSEGLRFYDSPANVSALAGEDVLLQCAARGFPTSIKYVWFRDNIPLQESDYVAIGSGNIKLEKVTLKDTGRYKCIATVSGNVEAKSQEVINLQINEPPRFSVAMERFIQLQGEEEGSIVLPCPAIAQPAPLVSWYVDKKPLKIDGVYFVQEPDSLQIYGLLKSDSSIYECVAENEYGSIYRIFQLTVLPKSPAKAYTSISQPLKFSALSKTISSVVLSWEPPLTKRDDFARYLISYHEKLSSYPRVKKVTVLKDKLTLEIGNLQEDTFYQFNIQGVSLKGDLGQIASTSVKTLKRTLAGDIKVTVVKVDAQAALLNWRAQSDSYKEFQLETVNACFTNKPQAKRVKVVYREFLLQNLEESCIYNVTVSSGNNQGQVALGTARFKTMGARPSAAPLDVRAMGVDPKKIEVWWSEVPKPEQNGKITSYLVRYRPEKLKKGVNTKALGSEKGTHLVLDSLEKNSNYQVAVAAGNEFGFGPYSEWFAATTLQNTLTEDRVPGKVKKLSVVDVSDSSITVKWEGTEDGETIRVRSYVLYIDQIVPIHVAATVPATDDRYTFTNLRINKNYIIKVAAKNNIGSGPDSLVYQKTSEAPSAYDMPLQMPNNVSVTPINSGQLSVSFTSNNPTKDDSWFKIRVTWRYPTVFTQEFTCRPPMTSCTVSGLRPGTEYEVKVQAYRGDPDDPNAISSPWSMTASGRTQETMPGSPPTDLTASPVKGKPNNVLLMWMAPTDPNGAITGYDLSYSTDPTAKEWALDHVEENVLSHEVKDLTLQTTYYFKIAARNKKGLGPILEHPIKFTTPATGLLDTTSNELMDRPQDGGLDKEYFYIMIAAVVGFTVIVVCLIIAFVVCRIINHQAAASIIDKQSVLGRPDSSMTQQGSLYAAAGKQTQLQQPDVTDLYVHKDQFMEMKGGKELSMTYMPAGSGSHISNGGNDYMRSGSPPDIQKHLMSTNFSTGSPSPAGYPPLSMTPQGMMHMQTTPSPNALKQMQLAAAHGIEMQPQQKQMAFHQQPNLIRPTPVRMGGQLPPPLHQHPHSMQSEVPMMAIKPMLMQQQSVSNHTTPTPMANSPHCYSGGSTGPYKHYESDNLGDYNGSENAVYSPPSSLSGGNLSHDGSLGRSGGAKFNSNVDKALKALPAMPPELKPLSSLSSPSGPVLPITSMNNHPSQYLQMHNNLPVSVATAINPNVQPMMPPVTSAHYRPPNHPRMGAGNQGHGLPNEFYNHSVMQQEADACVDKIAGLMNKLNSAGSANPGYPLHRSGEMDC